MITDANLPPPNPGIEPGTRPSGGHVQVTSRIVALDVLRGFALTGIIFVNVEPVTHFGEALDPVAVNLGDPSGWLQLFVQQRFFSLFSLLFGISFSLLVASAARRGANPRVVLARRLLVLLPLGVAHQLLQPGEALAPYAVVGLLVLLPSTWIPRWLVAGGGVMAFLVALLGFGGGILLIPGLFLLGSALVRYGVVDRMGGSARVPLVLFLLFTVVSVPAFIAQLGDLEGSDFTTSSAVAGAAMTGVYATALLLALQTPLHRVLVACFAPLGRMALTNYIGATLAMVMARSVLHLQDSTSWTTVLSLAAGIIVVQASVSTWWLRRYRYGPLEWLWRWATWGERPDFYR